MASENGQEKRETLADIVAQIRAAAYIQNADTPKSVLRLADRIEAAWRREKAENEADALSVGGIVEAARHKPGNAAAMREALRALRDASRDFYNQILNSKYSEILDKYTCVKQGFPAVLDLRSAFPMAKAALSAPARNCDSFATANEGRRAFNAWLKHNSPMSFGGWLFRLAEERKGEGDGGQ